MKRLIVLLFAAQAFGAEYYVRSSGGNDLSDGSTWALGKATIGGGLAVATSSGDRVNVSPGTYNAESSGRVTFGTSHNGDTITVRKWAGVDGGDNACPIADGACIFSSTNSAALLFNTSCLSGTFTWDGIDVTSTNILAVDFDDAVQTFTATIKNCTINGYSYMVGVQAPARNIVYENVTFAPQSTSPIINCNSVGNLTLKNCTMARTTGSSPSTGYIVLAGLANSDLSTLFIDNCNLSNTVDGADKLIHVKNGIASGLIYIRDSTLENTRGVLQVDAASASTVRVVCERTTFTGHSLSNNAYSIVSLGAEADTTSNALGVPEFLDCTINSKGDDAQITSLRFGPECTGFNVYRCVIRGQSYWEPSLTGDGKGIGIYAQGAKYGMIAFTDAHCRSAFTNILGNGTRVIHCTGYQNIGNGDNTAPLAIRDENGGGADADTKDLFIADNIFAVSGDANKAVAVTPHTSGMDLTSLIFRDNLYYVNGVAAGSNAFRFVSTNYAYDGLAAMWASVGGIAAYNDAASVYVTPGLIDPAGGDLRATALDAKGNKAVPVNLRTWNGKGAYGEKGGGGSRRR